MKNILNTKGKIITAGVAGTILVSSVLGIGYQTVTGISKTFSFNPKPLTSYTQTVETKRSLAVDNLIEMLDHEVNVNGWGPNTPFYKTTQLFDNQPNFQEGEIYGASRITEVMLSNIGRLRGTGREDDSLKKVNGILKVPADLYMLNPLDSEKATITESADSQYKRGIEGLLSYNSRVETGEAIYDVRTDSLIALLDIMSKDIGSNADKLAKRGSNIDAYLFDTQADDIFYETLGQTYAYTVFLQGVEQDFIQVLKDKNLQDHWSKMMDELKGIQQYGEDVLFVANGPDDGILGSSHLTGLANKFMTARAKMVEGRDILLK